MVEANPFAPPRVDVQPEPDRGRLVVATPHDHFIVEAAQPLLEPGEELLHTAFTVKAPPLWVQILFMGIVILFFFRYYLTAITSRRILLFRTRQLWIKPQLKNLGVEEIRWAEVARIEVAGLANNRSLKLILRDGSSRTLRIAPWVKFVSGQQAFFERAKRYQPGLFEG